MHKHQIAKSYYVRKIIYAFIILCIAGLMVITFLDSSILKASLSEWASMAFIIIGLTTIYSLVSLSILHNTYVVITAENVEIHYKEKVVKIPFSTIKFIDVSEGIPLLWNHCVVIETEQKNYYLYLSKSACHDVVKTVKGESLEENVEDGRFKYKADKKSATLTVWCLDIIFVFFIIFIATIPVIFGILDRFSPDANSAKIFYVSSLGVGTVIGLIVALGIFLFKANRYQNQHVYITDKEIVLAYNQLGYKRMSENRSDIMAVYVRRGLFGRILGVGHISIVTRNYSTGVRSVDYFPFLVRDEKIDEILQVLGVDREGEEGVKPAKKDFALCYFNMSLLSLISIIFSIMYHPLFLALIPAWLLCGYLYIKHRHYAVGKDYFFFRTGVFIKEDAFIFNHSVEAVSCGKDFILSKTKSSRYSFYLHGYVAKVTVGVWGDELRKKIKDKIDI